MFGNLRVQSVWIWKFTCDTNCQHEWHTVKSRGLNTDKNEDQTSCFEKGNQIKVESIASYWS